MCQYNVYGEMGESSDRQYSKALNIYSGKQFIQYDLCAMNEANAAAKQSGSFVSSPPGAGPVHPRCDHMGTRAQRRHTSCLSPEVSMVVLYSEASQAHGSSCTDTHTHG